MKKIISILMVCLILITIGCGKGVVEEQQQTEEEQTAVTIVSAEDKEVMEEPKEEPKEEEVTEVNEEPKEATITDETIDIVNNKLDTTSRFVISHQYKELAVGESFVFGFGILNIDTIKPKDFKIDIIFDKCIDHYSNKIQGVEEDVLSSWADETQYIFTLEPKEEKIIPVKFTVGDKFGADKEASTASCYYDVRVYTEDVGSPNINDEYVSRKQLSIRVK